MKRNVLKHEFCPDLMDVSHSKNMKDKRQLVMHTHAQTRTQRQPRSASQMADAAVSPLVV